MLRGLGLHLPPGLGLLLLHLLLLPLLLRRLLWVGLLLLSDCGCDHGFARMNADLFVHFLGLPFRWWVDGTELADAALRAYDVREREGVPVLVGVGWVLS